MQGIGLGSESAPYGVDIVQRIQNHVQRILPPELTVAHLLFGPHPLPSSKPNVR